MPNAREDPTSGDHVVAVSAGSSHTVALLNTGHTLAWGNGEDGQLGMGDPQPRLVPTIVPALTGKGITAVYSGAEHTVAHCPAQKLVYSWGWGDFGRLGHGHSNDVFVPLQISSLSGIAIKRVACGDNHTMAITANGTLFAFGRNQNGQLGLGHTEDVLTPTIVENLKDTRVGDVSCGAEHTVACSGDGTAIYAWGWGRYGNLGNGDREDRHVPTKAEGLPENVTVESVACGWRHSVAVCKGGAVYTFGWAKYGQLGHGDRIDCLRPKLLEAIKNVTFVAGGWRHTAALCEDGLVYTWGWNKFGQLGLGDDEDRDVPCLVAMSERTPVLSVKCGWRHTVALTRCHKVFSWGRGVDGQLGHGATDDALLPRELEVLSAPRLRVQDLPAGPVAAVDQEVDAMDQGYAVVPEDPSAKRQKV
ncbi:unnamed protein product [Pedinophyceae sp. YPF-701]|nr:unnamed protein product [Pedinophyceae sp. YPF-701]